MSSLLFLSEMRVSYFSSSFTFQACPGSPPKISKMEPFTTTYPLKYSVPKARVVVVFLSVVLCTTILCLLQLRIFKPKIKDFYFFEVKDSRGRNISLGKYRGKILQRKSLDGISGSTLSVLRVKL
ncbi:probable glutathione peroxidase 8 isoform X2 [Neopelma chrysocephalum]|uniref:probable glutathione peroxidase 8 isoform X2 n=1 Tax=Neopelma chrysocephalum TaxID=114329 RepID=UPI000FCD19DE|nr:probable glutathione peroxidase 8 isoform X2 [Neopelma chrysocephalum]